MTRFALLPICALLAACSGSEPAPPAQTGPAPVTRPAPPPPAPVADAAWQDAPLTPGKWVTRRDARGTLALFGTANAAALVTLRCDTSRRALYLSRASAASAPTALTIRSFTLSETVRALPTGGTPPYVAAEFAADAPILAAAAFSRGRFAIDSADGRLILPARPDLTRVIEDCHR